MTGERAAGRKQGRAEREARWRGLWDQSRATENNGTGT